MVKFKKIVSLLLTLCLIMGLSTTTYALDSPNLTVLKNDVNECIVKEITSDGITIATNNKVTNILVVDKYNMSGSVLVSSVVIDLNTIADQVGTSKELENRIHWGNGDAYQHTFSNREYDIWYGNPNEWKCRVTNSTRWINETSSNLNALESFRQDVEDVNEAEYVIIGAVGATVAVTAIAAFVTGGAAAGAAAAGGSATVVAAFANLNKACNNADYHFNRI